MAILFKGEKINEALGQHEESLKSHRTELSGIQATLEDKVDRAAFQAQLEQASTASAKALEAAVREREQQVSALRDRTSALEARQQEILAALAAKAEAAALESGEAHLASGLGALERRLEDLSSTVGKKADDARVEGHERQLATVEERLGSLQVARERLDSEVAAKASSAHLDEQRERLSNLSNLLQEHVKDLNSTLETKASLKEHTELGGSHAGLQSKLAELEKDLTVRLGEIDAELAKKVDCILFDMKAAQLSQAREQLDTLERRQSEQHGQVHEVLNTKANKDAAEEHLSDHRNLSEACAYREEVARTVAHLQDQLDACRAQAVRYHDAASAELATKVETDTFERRWDQVITKEIRPNIRSQREQLNAALEKKDQLIALAERMQADLGCALALRGRGPPRLGPLVPPPAPSPRKVRGAARAATPDAP